GSPESPWHALFCASSTSIVLMASLSSWLMRTSTSRFTPLASPFGDVMPNPTTHIVAPASRNLSASHPKSGGVIGTLATRSSSGSTQYAQSAPVLTPDSPCAPAMHLVARTVKAPGELLDSPK